MFSSNSVDKMISGSKVEFAIEYELNENHGGAWLFGSMCYWIDGIMIVKFDEGTSLRDVMQFITGIVKYCNRRKVGLLCHQSGEEIFNILEKVIYGDGDDRFDLLVTDEFIRQVPGVLQVKPGVDIFDGTRVYLLECGEVDRILFVERAGEPVNSIELPNGQFQAVITVFYQWLECVYEKALRQ